MKCLWELVGKCPGLFALIECFHSRDQHRCKFIGTKETVCIRKEFNSQRTGLGHQYGRRDVMWKHSINGEYSVPITCLWLLF